MDDKPGCVLSDPGIDIYFDAQVTTAREPSLRRAIAAGKHVYTEKPVADSLDGAVRLARAAARPHRSRRRAGQAVLRGSLSSAGSLRTALRARSLGAALSSATGPSRATGSPRSAPPWNYRKEQGGGIVLDMFPHWQYLLEDLFGPSRPCTRGMPLMSGPVGRARRAVRRTADDAVRAAGVRQRGGRLVNSSWTVRVNRRELVELHVDGTAAAR